MTASPRLIDLDALVDVSNYSSLETCIIRPCQSLCNSHSSSQLAYSLRLCVFVCVSAHTPNYCDSTGVIRHRVIITTQREHNASINVNRVSQSARCPVTYLHSTALSTDEKFIAHSLVMLLAIIVALL